MPPASRVSMRKVTVSRISPLRRRMPTRPSRPSVPPASHPCPFSITIGRSAETARFRLVYLPPDKLLPGLGIHVNQRVTPELMWRGQNLSHTNGTLGIAGIVAVATDPAAMAALCVPKTLSALIS
jgi:hypothetical protein